MWKRTTPYWIAILLFALGTFRLYDRGDMLGMVINGLAGLAVMVGLVIQLVRPRRDKG